MTADTQAENTPWSFPFSQVEWDQTPSAVQTYLLTLQTQLDALQQQHQALQCQVDQLQGRVEKTSQTSSKPPSSDSPFNKSKGGGSSGQSGSSGKRGGRQGHPGSGPILLEPTKVQVVHPASCECGHSGLVTSVPYHTHQVIELPPIEMQITHFELHQGHCVGCGRLLKAEVPSGFQTGYGPRLSALIGELSGMHGTSRRLIQDFCHSVLHIPMSLGAVQKIVDRVSESLVPHYGLIAELARQAPVGYLDETPWYCQNALQWLWTMATDTVTLYLIHPKRSKEAFFDLIEDWDGLLVSDGYGVYEGWVNRRQTCLAHLIRTARGLSEKRDPELAACGARVLSELQRLCHMAKAPPSGGEWNAWYARFCGLIGRYYERQEDAGRLARRLQREMASLWVFLLEHGVEATNNRAERALRFGVLWRKRSSGTDSVKGNRWVERILSLRQTCRQRGQSSFGVLVDALSSAFSGRQPDLSWLY
jgi:transposase